jgi:hypothetical protein
MALFFFCVLENAEEAGFDVWQAEQFTNTTTGGSSSFCRLFGGRFDSAIVVLLQKAAIQAICSRAKRGRHIVSDRQLVARL